MKPVCVHLSPLWHPLEIPSTESWVYVACWMPRSQIEVIRWIYGDSYPTNIAPIIRARKSLEDRGFLKTTRSIADGRSLVLTSSPSPFVPYAGDRLATRKSLTIEAGLSEDEQNVVHLIMDSHWFRQSFDQELPYFRNLGMLKSDGALRTIAECVEEIATISFILHQVFRTSIPISMVGSFSSFDEFMKVTGPDLFREKPRILNILPLVARNLRRELPFPRTSVLIHNTLDHSLVPPLWIPEKLAEKLSRVGRIQLTLEIYLMRAIERALK